MNIFVLDSSPSLAAQSHCDKHVVKMILESAQLLCTAHHELDESSAPAGLYRPTHKNHPCAIWTRESVENYVWLYQLFDALCAEYNTRYNKVHLTEEKLLSTLSVAPRNIPQSPATPFALAMPEKYRSLDAVQSYRAYYLEEKRHIAKWKTITPYWWN